MINIIIFATDCQYPYVGGAGSWHDIFNFNGTIASFINSFFHFNWQHVLLNMLCFLGVGLYFERKKGTLGLLLYVLFGAYFAGIAVAGNNLSTLWVGYSGVNYYFYGMVIVDYIFSFQKESRNKTNIIMGAIILALIYLAMCFCGETSGIDFRWYPYDLMTNMVHYSSFVVGLVLALIIQFTRFIAIKTHPNKKPKE